MSEATRRFEMGVNKVCEFKDLKGPRAQKALKEAVDVLLEDLKSSRKRKKGSGVMVFLLRMVGRMDDVQKLSDEKLASAVLEEVWAGLSMESRESALLGEMVGRFKRMSRRERCRGRLDVRSAARGRRPSRPT